MPWVSGLIRMEIDPSPPNAAVPTLESFKESFSIKSDDQYATN